MKEREFGDTTKAKKDEIKSCETEAIFHGIYVIKYGTINKKNNIK